MTKNKKDIIFSSQTLGSKETQSRSRVNTMPMVSHVDMLTQENREEDTQSASVHERPNFPPFFRIAKN